MENIGEITGFMESKPLGIRRGLLGMSEEMFGISHNQSVVWLKHIALR